MIKKVCLSIVCLAVGLAASAQSQDVEETVVYEANPHKVITNTFWNNWFVSVGGGAQVYFGDGDSQGAFEKRITPAFDVAVGKWFSPVVGARLMYSGFTAKGASRDAFLTGERVNSKYGYSKFNVNNLHADFMLNVNSLFAGYKADRVWNFIPYLGVGWAFHDGNNEPSVNAGILNAFRVSDALDINLDIRGMLVNDNFDGEMGGRQSEGLLTAAVGLTYKFKARNWETPKTVTRTDRSEANALLKKLDAANAENEALKKALAESEAKNAEKAPVMVSLAADDIVLFPIGKMALTKEARVNLAGFAGMIKDMDPKNVYVITGYADNGTGSEDRNLELSKGRAEAAYNCLVNELGVNPDQLKVDYKGGVDNMFYDDPSLSRAVIITLQ